MRLHGVGPKRAKLLLKAGMDSLAILSQQERGALMEQMAPFVKEVGLHRLPSGRQVRGWIEQAKTLQDVI
jgi:predicted flap endonuclease-1-like 5' DNA nuclease